MPLGSRRQDQHLLPRPAPALSLCYNELFTSLVAHWNIFCGGQVSVFVLYTQSLSMIPGSSQKLYGHLKEGGTSLCYKSFFLQPGAGLKGEPGVSMCLAGDTVMTLLLFHFCCQANGLPVLLSAMDCLCLHCPASSAITHRATLILILR